MRLIKISDETERADGIRYISAALKNVISETGGAISEKYNGDRAELKIKIPERFVDYIRSEAEDKIADVVAVGFKRFRARNFIQRADRRRYRRR